MFLAVWHPRQASRIAGTTLALGRGTVRRALRGGDPAGGTGGDSNPAAEADCQCLFTNARNVQDRVGVTTLRLRPHG